MGLSNDERGWVMTGLSGIACIIGASIICVDVFVRLIPGKKNFRIQDSDSFLSTSLSLSFGVMLFSALYSMLPSAKTSLIKGGYSSKEASWILIACFLGGVIGIQVVSRVIHHFIPSHVVNCEHSHDSDGDRESSQQNEHAHKHDDGPSPGQLTKKESLSNHMHQPTKDAHRQTDRQESYFGSGAIDHYGPTLESERSGKSLQSSQPDGPVSRPTLQQRITSRLSSITSAKKSFCDCNGPCYGFSDPCGQECFKNINARGANRSSTISRKNGDRLRFHAPMSQQIMTLETTPLLHVAEESGASSPPNHQHSSNRAVHNPPDLENGSPAGSDTLSEDEAHHLHKTSSAETTSSHTAEHHHHHVPNNAFLSIGLQTSIAIALHKLPEGFITYATNHANPKLGVSVFLALFIHNITEGFAMALPLYLAINSRLKAMLWSFVLGGLSQPLGAGVAALWFKVAGKTGYQPEEGVYGAMFALTAGIMASVALQLFSESLDLTHSRNLCMIGAFTGMAVLGVSSALTA